MYPENKRLRRQNKKQTTTTLQIFCFIWNQLYHIAYLGNFIVLWHYTEKKTSRTHFFFILRNKNKCETLNCTRTKQNIRRQTFAWNIANKCMTFFRFVLFSSSNLSKHKCRGSIQNKLSKAYEIAVFIFISFWIIYFPGATFSILRIKINLLHFVIGRLL